MSTKKKYIKKNVKLKESFKTKMFKCMYVFIFFMVFTRINDLKIDTNLLQKKKKRKMFKKHNEIVTVDHKQFECL